MCNTFNNIESMGSKNENNHESTKKVVGVAPLTSLTNSSFDLSNGFRNTLNVLDKQIKQKRWLPTLYEEATTTNRVSCTNLTGLDLQLLAIERLHELKDKQSRLARFLINFILTTETNVEKRKINLIKLKANLQHEQDEQKPYHIAKDGKHGNVYIRVVQSPTFQGILTITFLVN